MESTAVYPTKYFPDQLEGVDPRFYSEMKMIVVIPSKNPNVDFHPNAAVYPAAMKAEYKIPAWIEEKVPNIEYIKAPIEPDMIKPVLEITNKEIDDILIYNVLEEIGVDRLKKEEIESKIQELSEWISEKIKDSNLQLTDEAKNLLLNLLILIMKKTDYFVKHY